MQLQPLREGEAWPPLPLLGIGLRRALWALGQRRRVELRSAVRCGLGQARGELSGSACFALHDGGWTTTSTRTTSSATTASSLPSIVAPSSATVHASGRTRGSAPSASSGAATRKLSVNGKNGALSSSNLELAMEGTKKEKHGNDFDLIPPPPPLSHLSCCFPWKDPMWTLVESI